VCRALPLWIVLLLVGCYDDPFGGPPADDDFVQVDDDDDSSLPADDDDSGPADDDDVGPDDDDLGPDDDDIGPIDDDDTTPEPAQTTLVSIDDSTHELLLVDEVTGAGTPLVSVTPETGFCSTVFTRAGTIYVSNGGDLWILDPCTGVASHVGQYGDDATICGIATDDLNSLYGVDRNTNELVSIDPSSAALTPVGPTGVDWGTHGLTWDDAGQRFLSINGADDNLYALDPATGAATLLAPLDLPFATVGVEMDPVSGELFACTEENLLHVEVGTGAVTVIGPIYVDESCDDLGATWLEVPCVGR